MKKLVIFFLFFTLFSVNSFAISSTAQQQSRAAHNILIQRVKQRAVDVEKRKDEEKVEKNLEDEVFTKNIKCFSPRKIIFSKNKLISKLHEARLLHGYHGKCLTKKEIADLNDEISQYLVKEGYVTSSSEIKIHGNILEFFIHEGKLEKITLNEEKISDKMQKFTAFGYNEEGDYLDSKKLSQGLNQMNRLSSNSARIKLSHGTKPDHSVVHVENKINQHRKTIFSATYDNSGNKATGERIENLSISHDNLFSLNDNLTISRSGNDMTDKKRKTGGNNNLVVNFTVPFSWYTLSYTFVKSSYFFNEAVDPADGIYYNISGDATAKIVTLDRLLVKNDKYQLNGTVSVNDSSNYLLIDHVKDYGASRKATVGSFSLSNIFYFPHSTLFIKPAFNKSLNILNAQKDPAGLSSTSPHAEFTSWTLNSNFSHEFQDMGPLASYGLEIDGQMSDKALYGADQISTGGLYTVRGFKDGAIVGDSGYNIRNELTFLAGKTILSAFGESKTNSFLANLNKFSVTPFYDYGHVRSKGGQQSGRLSGTGFRMDYSGAILRASLTMSWALSRSQNLGVLHENSAIYFSVGASY